MKIIELRQTKFNLILFRTINDTIVTGYHCFSIVIYNFVNIKIIAFCWFRSSHTYFGCSSYCHWKFNSKLRNAKYCKSVLKVVGNLLLFIIFVARLSFSILWTRELCCDDAMANLDKLITSFENYNEMKWFDLSYFYWFLGFDE